MSVKRALSLLAVSRARLSLASVETSTARPARRRSRASRAAARRRRAERSDEEVERGDSGGVERFLEGHDEAVFTDGEADAGGGNARAERLREAIVAAAAADGILGAESAVEDLEGGLGVVIEAADEARADFVGDAANVEEIADTGEVGAALVVQEFVDGGQRGDDGLVAGVLRVEDAEGVRDGAALVVGRELILDGIKGFAEGGGVALAGFGIADGVDQQFGAGDAAAFEDLDGEFDHFGVDGGGIGADALGADLEELPVAALLGAFAAEHGAEVEEFLEAGDLIEAVLDVGANDGGGVLGAESE